ncbi:hypothetical protein CBER1_05534 [Cercospora berteroae]|uniref:Uncharacterized protein n=1 Tax=Cercospora berteroae TaxID=357750 RepID=A0A2S6BSU2_9PEZI|nr:hypothetical protein CBER1_05534 [Cercospora berteroae]
MGAGRSTLAPELPYTGPVYQSERTYDIICTDYQGLAGAYDIRQNGALQYHSKLTRAKHRIDVITVHRVSNDGRIEDILAACRSGGHFSDRFGLKQGDPFVPGTTVIKKGREIPEVCEKKYWPKIKPFGKYGATDESYAFEVGPRKFRWQRTEARYFIGHADRVWAHWLLLDMTEPSRRVSAAYIHSMDNDSAGHVRVAQMKLYYNIDPLAEAMALAVIIGLEIRRGPLRSSPAKSSSGSGGGGGDFVGGFSGGDAGGTGGDGGCGGGDGGRGGGT